MKSTNESLILLGCVVNQRDGECVGTLARQLGNMRLGKNDTDALGEVSPTHNRYDVFIGIGLYADGLETEIMAILAGAGTPQ